MNQVSALRGHAERLCARAPKGIFRFLSVGMVGLATHTGVFTLLYRLGVSRSPAWFVGLAIGTMVTWRLNRRLTFVSSGRRPRTEVLRYALVTAVAQGVSFAVFKSIGVIDPVFPAPVALIAGAVVATLFSYTGQRFFTFAPPKDAGASETAPVLEVPVV